MPENLSDRVGAWRTLVESLRKHREELPQSALGLENTQRVQLGVEPRPEKIRRQTV